jgi:hypothetical protein
MAAVGLRPRYEVKRTLRDASSVIAAEKSAAEAAEKAEKSAAGSGPALHGAAAASSSSSVSSLMGAAGSRGAGGSQAAGHPLQGSGRKFDVRYAEVPGVTSSAREFHIRALADDIKRDQCFVSPTRLGARAGAAGSLSPPSAAGTADLSRQGSDAYELPDGSVLRLGAAASVVPEVLFDPKAANALLPGAAEWEHAEGSQGVQDLIQQAIDQADVDIRRELYSNIVVTGGVSRTKGFGERLLSEMYGTAPQNFATRIKLVNVHQFAPQVTSHTWLGGSILASLGSFQQEWISKKEYEDGGVGAVDRKCA